MEDTHTSQVAAAIAVEGLTKHYGDVTAVDDLSFTAISPLGPIEIKAPLEWRSATPPSLVHSHRPTYFERRFFELILTST